MKKSLPLHEWFLLIGVFGAILSFCTFSYLASRESAQLLKDERILAGASEKIFITIDGEVKKPGRYSVVKDSLVEDILPLAKPKRFANLKIFHDKKVMPDQAITVPLLEKISVTLRGAVTEEQEIKLPIKSRFLDLKKFDIFLENADLDVLKSRRYLDDGIEVIIPFLPDANVK